MNENAAVFVGDHHRALKAVIYFLAVDMNRASISSVVAISPALILAVGSPAKASQLKMRKM
jgi:hypothetical protein